MTTRALMGIGDFAVATGLTAKALRLYDELEILPPAEVDPCNGYRRYAPEQLDVARLVARLRLIGMPLSRVRVMAHLEPAAALAELSAYWRQVEADTASRRELVASLVSELKAQEAPMSTTPTTHGWTVRVATRDQIGGRDTHQDAVHAGPSVFAVADGFGEGDRASRTAIEEVAALDTLDAVATGAALDELEAAVTRAGARIAEQAAGGTTLTACWLHDGEVAVAHIGDTRLYRLRAGEVERLTRDHSMVTALIEEGRLTEEEARCHPDRVRLNRALAPEAPAEADLSVHDVRSGDRLVLTSDGVHAVLPAEELAEVLGGGDPETVADRVVAAVEAAGAPDNFALVVADLA